MKDDQLRQEGKMFDHIKEYLKKINQNKGFFYYNPHQGADPDKGWKLKITKYCSEPDVYGLDDNDEIYLCQGKLIVGRPTDLWTLLGQALSNRYFCNYLYIFFEKEALDEDLRKTLEEILKQLKIGLLVINKDLIVDLEFKAERFDAPEENLEAVRKKILPKMKILRYTKKFRKFISENIDKGYKVEYPPRSRGQIEYYISPHEWQPRNNLKYIIKFLKGSVLIGLTIHHNLVEKGFIEELYNRSKNLSFNSYNRQKLDKNFDKTIFKLKNQNKGNDLSEALPLTWQEFFENYKTPEGQNKAQEIIDKLNKVINKLPPNLLEKIINELE